MEDKMLLKIEISENQCGLLEHGLGFEVHVV